MRRVGVLTPALMGATLDVSIYNDDDTSPTAGPVSVSLENPGWKWANVTTIGKPATQFRVDLSFTSLTKRLQLRGLQVEGMVYERRGVIQ